MKSHLPYCAAIALSILLTIGYNKPAHSGEKNFPKFLQEDYQRVGKLVKEWTEFLLKEKQFTRIDLIPIGSDKPIATIIDAKQLQEFRDALLHDSTIQRQAFGTIAIAEAPVLAFQIHHASGTKKMLIYSQGFSLSGTSDLASMLSSPTLVKIFKSLLQNTKYSETVSNWDKMSYGVLHIPEPKPIVIQKVTP